MERKRRRKTNSPCGRRGVVVVVVVGRDLGGKGRKGKRVHDGPELVVGGLAWKTGPESRRGRGRAGLGSAQLGALGGGQEPHKAPDGLTWLTATHDATVSVVPIRPQPEARARPEPAGALEGGPWGSVVARRACLLACIATLSRLSNSWLFSRPNEPSLGASTCQAVLARTAECEEGGTGHLWSRAAGTARAGSGFEVE